MNDKPVKTIHAGGGVKANVWLNQGGEDQQPFYSFSIIRSYRGQDDQWHETNSYRRDDLPRIEYATRKAYDFILSKQYDSPEHGSNEAKSHADRVQESRSSSEAGKP